jgi:AraC-like DNA-binding protein
MGESGLAGFAISPFRGLSVTYSRKLRSGFPPHRHPHFEIFWVTEGEGEAMVDSAPVSIRPMTLFLINPGEVHNFASTFNLSGVLMHISPQFIATLDTVLPVPMVPSFWRPHSQPVLALDPAEQKTVAQIFLSLCEDAAAPPLHREGFIKAHLMLLFSKMRSYYLKRALVDQEPAESLITRRFQTALRAQCPPMVTVKQFADSLGVSRSFLHRTVSRETGQSPSGLIHERLMVEAKRQLLHTNSDLSVIARQLGFGDASYFGRFFQRYAKTSPSRFRRHQFLLGPR